MKRKTGRKVLIVNTTPFGPGGIAKVIASYYEQIYTQPLVMDIVANNAQMPQAYQTLFQKGFSQMYCFPRKKGIIKYIWNLFRVCLKGKYDMIHVHGNSATMAIELFVAYVCRIKRRIAHCHTSRCEHPKAHKLLMPLFSRLYTDALACSSAAGEWIFGKGRFLVLNNAIAVENYAYCETVRQTYRKKLGVEDGTLLLGHVGYFNPTKNQGFLLKAVKALEGKKDVKLILIGTGAMKDEIQQQAQMLGLNDRVQFLGERNDIAQLLQAMDVFLFPSQWEGLGLALIEAQLTGLYCIASEHVPGEANLDGKVTYLPINDPCQWALHIQDLHPSCSRSAASEAAIGSAERNGFSIRKEAEKLTKLYIQ